MLESINLNKVALERIQENGRRIDGFWPVTLHLLPGDFILICTVITILKPDCEATPLLSLKSSWTEDVVPVIVSTVSNITQMRVPTSAKSLKSKLTSEISLRL